MRTEKADSTISRRDPVRMEGIIASIMKERNLTGKLMSHKVLSEAKQRYSAVFRIPYTTKRVNKYNDDGTLHPEFID